MNYAPLLFPLLHIPAFSGHYNSRQRYIFFNNNKHSVKKKYFFFAWVYNNMVYFFLCGFLK